MLFICGGAFVDLDKVVERRIGKHVLGFSGDGESDAPETALDSKTILRHVEPEDLLGYGFIPEFIGRLPVHTALQELDEEQLVRVMTEPKNALIKQYAKLLEKDGVKLNITDGAMRELAKAAIKRGTGARGLVTILERTLRDHKYELPSSSVTAFTVANATVVDPQAALPAPTEKKEARIRRVSTFPPKTTPG